MKKAFNALFVIFGLSGFQFKKKAAGFFIEQPAANGKLFIQALKALREGIRLAPLEKMRLNIAEVFFNALFVEFGTFC